MHEAAGDTSKAIEAYRRIADMRGDGAPPGRAVAERYRARIDALKGR